MPSTYYTIKCFIYGSSLGAVLPRSYQHHHLLAGSHAGQEGRGGTQKVALGPRFGSFENLSIRIYASSPPLTKQLQAKYLFSLSEAGTNGAEGQSPVYRGRKDIFSGLADKLKKKNKPQVHNPLFPFIPQSRNHGLFPAVSRGPQNPAHGGFLQHPAICDGYRTWPFQRCCLQSMCHGLLHTTSNLPQIQPLYQPWGFSKSENLYSNSTRH